MTKIGLISNPHSRRNRLGLAEVETMVRGRPDVVHRRLGVDADVAILTDFARREVDVLAINGGDGTVQRLLTILLGELNLEQPPPIAVLAGGTTNLIAGDVGLPGSPARGLRRLLEITARGGLDRCVFRRHVMRVDHLDGVAPQFGMFLGAGVLAHAISDHAARDTRKRLPGPLTLTLSVMRVLADGLRPQDRRRILRSQSIRLGLDGGPAREARRLLVFVTTLDRLALGTRPYWNQGTAPLRFTSVAAAPPHLLCASVRVLAGGGQRLPAEHYGSGSVQRLDLGLTDRVALDGELFPPAPGRLLKVTATRELRFVSCRKGLHADG